MKNSLINKEWHLHHRMPQRATIEQRIEWHLEHLKHCRCRTGLPAGLRVEMKKRNMTMPSIADDKQLRADGHPEMARREKIDLSCQ